MLFCDTDIALKELTTEFLGTYKQDFNGLVALAGIWLNRGAVKAAYQVYYTIKKLYPIQYNTNFILRLQFAECMRLNGFQSEALTEFRKTFESFDHSEKTISDELNAYSDLLLGFVLLSITVGDYEMAEKVMKCGINKRHILYKLANAELTLLKQGGDASATAGVYNDCKDQKDNPLLLALAIRAGKYSGNDTAEIEGALKGLIEGKFASITAIVEYCKLSSGMSTDCCKCCLHNTMLATIMSKSPDAGGNIYEALKTVYSKNNCPTGADISATVGSLGIKGFDEENVTIIVNAEAPQIADITDDYAKLAQAAEKEIEAMKSGKVEKAEPKAGKGGKKGKKKGKSGKKAGGGGGGGAVKAGPKPKVNYNATPLAERKKWAFQMADNLPTPRARDVSSWGAAEVGDFISKIPIFGLNEWYGNKFRESGVSGKMFLECNEQKLIKWGIDKKCHRARFRAEALAMKRRG